MGRTSDSRRTIEAWHCSLPSDRREIHAARRHTARTPARFGSNTLRSWNRLNVATWRKRTCIGSAKPSHRTARLDARRATRRQRWARRSCWVLRTRTHTSPVGVGASARRRDMVLVPSSRHVPTDPLSHVKRQIGVDHYCRSCSPAGGVGACSAPLVWCEGCWAAPAIAERATLLSVRRGRAETRPSPRRCEPAGHRRRARGGSRFFPRLP